MYKMWVLDPYPYGVGADISQDKGKANILVSTEPGPSSIFREEYLKGPDAPKK